MLVALRRHRLGVRNLMLAAGIIGLSTAALARTHFARSSAAEACAPDARLRLELSRVVSGPFVAPPVALIPNGDSSFIALDQSGTIRSVGDGPELAGLDPSLAYAGATRGGDESIVYTDRTLFRLASGRDVWAPLALDSVAGIRSVAVDGADGSLWIATGDDDHFTVRRFNSRQRSGPADREAFRNSGAWELTGNWRLAPVGAGAALAISTRLPFEVSRLHGDGRSTALTPLRMSDRYPIWPDSAAPYVSGLAPLDCGGVLVTLADLRSRTRWLFLIDERSAEVRKTTKIEATMGFFYADPEDHALYGFRATRDGGEMLVYRWTWLAPTGGE